MADLATLMKEKKLSPKSMRNYLSTLSTLYTFAMHPRRRWATVNPCTGIELPDVPQYDGIRYLEPGEVETLVRGAQAGAYEALDGAMYRMRPR